MTASESPAFPSVGARARFTPDKRFVALRDRAGQTCTVIEAIPPLTSFDFQVLFDGGETRHWAVLGSELSPLPETEAGK